MKLSLTYKTGKGTVVYSKNEMLELYKKLYGVGGSGIVTTKPISKDIVNDIK